MCIKIKSAHANMFSVLCVLFHKIKTTPLHLKLLNKMHHQYLISFVGPTFNPRVMVRGGGSGPRVYPNGVGQNHPLDHLPSRLTGVANIWCMPVDCPVATLVQ